MANEQLRAQLRAMTRGAYDLQRLRIQTGLRLCANFRNQLGQEAGDSEEDLDSEAQDVLKELRQSYQRLTDGIVHRGERIPKAKFKGDELISDYTIYSLVASYVSLEKVERQQFAALPAILEEFPIYREFLRDVTGIGPAMAAVILSEFDIHRSRYASSMWKYAGLDVAQDGLGRSRRADHLVDRDYTNAKGEAATRKSITFNPFLKTKLTGVLAGSFLKLGGPYKQHYYNNKTKLQNRTVPEGQQPWSKIRIHRAAMRYMVKMFLIDLYRKWRELEGLEIFDIYHEAKLGHTHSNHNGFMVPHPRTGLTAAEPKSPQAD